MKLHVVIATHQRRDLLERTLSSLAATRKPPEFERVIVIENGSNDGTQSLCKHYAKTLALDYFNHPHAGKSRAVQWAMVKLQKDFVLFLDDDIRLCENILETYATAVRQYGRGHFFGGPLHIDYEFEPEEWLKTFLPGSAIGWAPKDPNDPLKDKDRFLGTNIGAFVEDVIAVGGFQPNLGPGAVRSGTEGNPTGMEKEIQNRFLQAGIKPVYLEDAHVWHFVPRDRCTDRWALRRFYRNHFSYTLRENTRAPHTGRRCLGVPLAVWSKIIRKGTRSILGIFDSDPDRRFRSRKRFYQIRGVIHGYRFGNRQ